MALPSWFVCVLGMGTVFVGLLVLVLVCKLLGFFCKGIKDKPEAAAAAAAPAPDVIPNKQELIAAISAAVAEELGEDVTAVRITSIKKL